MLQQQEPEAKLPWLGFVPHVGGSSRPPLPQWDQGVPPAIPGTEESAPIVLAVFGRLKDALLISRHIVS